MIVGQDKLLNKLDSFTLDTLPHSIILLGELGCGKSLVCEYIANKFKLPMEDITQNITQEYIDELMLKPEPYLYKINARDISMNGQNTLLKFIEEPLNNAFIVICCDNKVQLLPTVLNRCQVYEFEKYSESTLQQFTIDNKVLLVAKTPGQAKEMSGINMDTLFDLVTKLFDKINIATYPNALSVANKIAFKADAVSGYDFNMFVNVLMYIITNKIVSNTDDTQLSKLYRQYELTCKLANDRYIANINKKHLFENYLISLKEISTC